MSVQMVLLPVFMLVLLSFILMFRMFTVRTGATAFSAPKTFTVTVPPKKQTPPTIDAATLAAMRAMVTDPEYQKIARHRDGISINSPMLRLASAVGLYDRSQPPAEGQPFTPVEEITQEQGVQWTIDALNAPGKIGLEGAKDEVLRELMKQKAPQTKAVALPWLV